MTISAWRLRTVFGTLLVYASFTQGKEPISAFVPRPATAKSPRTVLDDYVAKPDSAYQWNLLRTVEGDGFTVASLEMTSQTWRTSADVNRPAWKHALTIVIPKQVHHQIGMIFVGGGSNDSPKREKPDDKVVFLAKTTGSVVAELGMVPNQPLILNNDGQPRFEDDLLAAAWANYLVTQDPDWIPQLAMAKSVVRAMDTVTAYLAERQAGPLKVDRFVVAGGSKRGWTTWLAAAVDNRIVGIAPIVIDVLNVRTSMTHHYEAYGFWAPAIQNYVSHKIVDHIDDPVYHKLLAVVDPLVYADRLNIPTFVLNAAGDQFFLPDSSQYYFKSLKGPARLRYVANADHSLKGSDAVASLQAFYAAVLEQRSMPELSWTVDQAGSIRLTTNQTPVAVRQWTATNPSARDFRMETIGQAYRATPIASVETNVYVSKPVQPAQGWSATFLEAEFKAGASTFKFTTEVVIRPDKLPFSIETFRQSLPKRGG